jgi:hypothetical protein
MHLSALKIKLILGNPAKVILPFFFWKTTLSLEHRTKTSRQINQFQFVVFILFQETENIHAMTQTYGEQ